MLVGEHIAVRRDHEAAAGPDFDALEVCGLIRRAGFFELRVDAANQPNEHRRVGRRGSPLRRRVTRPEDQQNRPCQRPLHEDALILTDPVLLPRTFTLLLACVGGCSAGLWSRICRFCEGRTWPTPPTQASPGVDGGASAAEAANAPHPLPSRQMRYAEVDRSGARVWRHVSRGGGPSGPA